MKKTLMTCAAAATLLTQVPAVLAADKTTNVTTIIVTTEYVLSANELIGQDVENAAGETIASVDDLLVAQDGKTAVAVLSVGGFLGIGDKLIAVPYKELTVGADKVVLPGKSKEDLEKMAAFTYRDDSADRRWRQRYLTQADRTMDEWSDKVADAYETSANVAESKGEKISDEAAAAWDKTRAEFRDLKRATADTWDDAKAAFEQAMNDLEKSWNKATN